MALSLEGLLALLLELLSPRDVAGNLRSADDTSSAVLDWGHRERDSYPTAVSSDALGLEMVDPFSANERCENCRLFLKPVGWKQHRDRTADGLFRRISEDAFGSLVPAHDRPVEVLTDDSVVRGLNQRGEHLMETDGDRLHRARQSPPAGTLRR